MARWWCRTRTPGRFWRWRFGRRSTPTTCATCEPGSLTNHAVSDVYEPGSTFKLVTYSAALDDAGCATRTTWWTAGRADQCSGPHPARRRSEHFGRMHGPLGAGAVQRRRRGQDGAEGGPGTILQIHQGVRIWRSLRHRAARRDARAVAAAVPVGADHDRVDRDRAGGRGYAGPTGNHGSTIANGGVYLPPHVLLASRPTRWHPQAEADAVSSGE